MRIADAKAADRVYLAATAALAAQFAGLLAVTLITNYQFFFWALVAYVAQGPLRRFAEPPAA